MPVESAADRAALLEASEFGVAATYKGTDTVNGILKDDFVEGLADLPAGVATSAPVFVCRTADLDAAPEGDSLVVSGTTYTIVAHEPDGTGISKCILEEA